MDYRQLKNNEIRVIRLFTIRDGPQFATGPVCCEIEYVLLDDCFISTKNRSESLTKGHNKTWPPLIKEQIEIQPGRRGNSDSNVLWPKSEQAEQSSRASRRSRKIQTKFHNFPSSEQSSWDFGPHDPDANLPWRYQWGDYISLSYVWGDTTEMSEVFVNSFKFTITCNLEAALSHLRHHYRIKQGFRLWVDAICINQQDLEERAQQVPRMQHIYASAWHVLIWLGIESDDSNIAMIAMRYFGLRSRESDPIQRVYRYITRLQFNIPHILKFQWTGFRTIMRKEVFRAIYHFLARPYFQRLWILQEVASGAKDTPLLCGTRCILLEDLYLTLQLIRDMDGNQLGSQIVRSVVGTRGLFRSWDETSTGIASKIASEKLWERPIAIIEAQDIRPASASLNISANDAISRALILSREAQTGDERDRIYGILGLPCLRNVIKMAPDYNLTPMVTFFSFSKTLYETCNLNGLRLVASPVGSIYTKFFVRTSGTYPRGPKFLRRPTIVNTGCSHSLPSWVICWSCKKNPAYNLPNHLLSGLREICTPPLFQNNPSLMIIRGIIMDTVSSLSAFHATETNRSYPFNGDKISSIYGTESETREALWRTITANTLRSGSPLPPGSNKLLDRNNWRFGSLEGSLRRVFGLNNFYYRNKSMRLFDRTLEDWIFFGSMKSIVMHPRNFAKKYMAYSTLSLYTEEEKKILRDVKLRAMQVLAWRRLVTTQGGYLGLTPAATRTGDIIAIIPGCDMPVVLRREGSYYRVLGESYIHGITSEEIFTFIQKGTKNVINISLL